jgi:hypothetical protein
VGLRFLDFVSSIFFAYVSHFLFSEGSLDNFKEGGTGKYGLRMLL